ncbi:MAG: NYN domain-containing protein [Coriobacteriia bacterium]
MLRRLIVDGYNVIHADASYRDLAERDLDTARARLVEDVAAFAAGAFRATVVFDGAGRSAPDEGVHHVAGVAVVFSRGGADADTVIESLARRARERGEGAVVVTSDAQTQWAVMSGSTTRMSAAEFVRESRENAVRVSHSRSGGIRGPVEERVDPEVRAALFRWARSGR